MKLELDHVFVATADAEACKRALEGFGLDLDHQVVHRGQGTANFCEFFDNAYLEILYAQNRAELRSGVVRPLCLDERLRWRETGACPLGICFRSSEDGDLELLQEATWQYEARNRPVEESIPIITPPDSPSEPMVFLSRTSRPRWRRSDRGRLSKVVIHLPARVQLSDGVAWCAENGLLSIVDDDDYLMELEWSAGPRGEATAPTPDLPLVLRGEPAGR